MLRWLLAGSILCLGGTCFATQLSALPAEPDRSYNTPKTAMDAALPKGALIQRLPGEDGRNAHRKTASMHLVGTARLPSDFTLSAGGAGESSGGRQALTSAQSDGPAMAATVRQQWPAGVVTTQARPGVWAYEAGTLLDGMTAEGIAAHQSADLDYVKSAVDRWVQPDGSIQTESGKPFDPSLHTLDNLEPGRAVLFLYQQTHDERYRKAAAYLFARFAEQPRNSAGGYWHKQVYPDQMWLDGAYMAEPFRAAYAREFGPSNEFADIAKQFLLMEQNMRAPGVKGHTLLRHGWDSSKKEAWADKNTGLSQEVWARAMGWYAMALVDTLPSFPAGHPDRAKLIAVLQRIAAGIAAQQDAATGVWWDVLNKGGQPGNFREASASAMFTYALAKGVRIGYLPETYRVNAILGWNGLEKEFITREGARITLHGTVKVSGLGGKPYRAGDYGYYVREAVGDDDAKGVGAYLLAASEIQQISVGAAGARSARPAR